MIKHKSWTVDEILDATGGRLLSGFETRKCKSEFSGISIDSRNIAPDNVFVAIRGDVYDGHSFVGDVLEHGVRCLITEKNSANDLPCPEWQEKGIACVVVNDTTKSLGDLAAFNRKRSNASVVAITASNGKTTTRKMTASVLARRFCTLASRGSFNNEIGLPLTLLRLNDFYEWAVVELGMNNSGEIGKLGDICLPDVGVITNIGPAHIGKLGSLEAIMNAKGELLERIRLGGTAILNADDPRAMTLGERQKAKGERCLFYSRAHKPEAEIQAVSVKEEDSGISFTLDMPTESVPIHLGSPGSFMVSNALAAASVGFVLGLSAREIQAGLEDFRPVRGRMNILKTRMGVNIIDDTYNANPASMEAAIMTLRSLKGNQRGIVVSGDMLELGEYAESMHKKIGSLAAGSDIARLCIAGEFAEYVAEGSRDRGMDSRDIFIGNRSEIILDLTDFLRPDDWILIKGSRGMGMEEIVERINN
ncbi:MAG TPA: UDP-N-acetylmuramoyl-tripeptide--D-alanyl-D-alanine ligase [Desulfobacterales bacterium]|nr:UDP-N-acetylmuramoyl-tripeptide--D-alanyl-D-alanine ligase [Desulfobacterales bacterium]